ncbi:MAG: hypothetical protein ACP5HU_01030 [Phycisphaerae bacterium]
MTTTTEVQAQLHRPEPPTRERIEQARREQWLAIQNLRRRILEAVESPCRS